MHARLKESHGGAPTLTVVPPEGTVEFEQFLAEFVADIEAGETPEHFGPDHETATDCDRELLGLGIAEPSMARIEPTEEEEALLALGLPVAFLMGEQMPDGVDDGADCHRATVVSLDVARLRRFLREMHPVPARVIRLIYGIGCAQPMTASEVAFITGRTEASVARLLDLAMSELRTRFGVPRADAA